MSTKKNKHCTYKPVLWSFGEKVIYSAVCNFDGQVTSEQEKLIIFIRGKKARAATTTGEQKKKNTPDESDMNEKETAAEAQTKFGVLYTYIYISTANSHADGILTYTTASISVCSVCMHVL